MIERESPRAQSIERRSLGTRPRAVRVRAPSRLHFGMFAFGQPGERQFGGVGVMLDRPGIELRIAPAKRFQVDGQLGARTRVFAERVFRALHLTHEPCCRVTVAAAPAEHVGLGTGTQLGLAVAAGIQAFLGGGPLAPEELARLAGRGRRSAVGTHGFVHGGLLVEAGKRAEEEVSPLVARVELPSPWRFVLVSPEAEPGLSGQAERDAFKDLPPVPSDVTDRLCREVLLHLLPAASEGCFDAFSDSLYRYGHQAGLCFAAKQGGAYAGRLADWVNTLRSLGPRGVGQTSWGPTLFALLLDQASAEDFVERLLATTTGQQPGVLIAAPDRHGAKIEFES